MTQTTTKETIPTDITLSNELSTAVYSCNQAIDNANYALRQLVQEYDRYTMSTADIKDLTPDAVKRITEQRIRAVEASPLYLHDQKTDTIQQWREWQKKALIYAQVVEDVLQEYPEAQLTYDSGTHSLQAVGDASEYLKPRYTVKTPTQAHEHWQLCRIAHDAIMNLRAWEQKNSCRKYRLEQLLLLDAERFAASWAKGAMQRNGNTLEQARERAIREATEKTYL